MGGAHLCKCVQACTSDVLSVAMAEGHVHTWQTSAPCPARPACKQQSLALLLIVCACVQQNEVGKVSMQEIVTVTNVAEGTIKQVRSMTLS